MNIFEITNKTQDIVEAAKFIHGDKWEEVKAKYVKILKRHMEQHKTKNLLSSAIQMSKELDEERFTIVLIASAV